MNEAAILKKIISGNERKYLKLALKNGAGQQSCTQ